MVSFLSWLIKLGFDHRSHEIIISTQAEGFLKGIDVLLQTKKQAPWRLFGGV
jgi:hypothetical protein